MKYVIAIPCPDCMKSGKNDHGLSYMIDERSHRGLTKIFKSRESALDFVQKNLDKEDQEASMVIPIDEVVEFNEGGNLLK